MRLANIRSGDTTRAARVDGDTLVVFEDELTDLLRRPGWLDIARTSDGERVPAEGVCFAPLVTKPDKIICAGLNYKGHIAETGRPVPEYPFFFSKFPAALIGAHDDLQLPTVSEQTDREVELAVVIGKPARSVSESGALAAVAGYTIINDVTGSPSGVGGLMKPPRFLTSGDVLTTAIEEIGELRNVCR